ncbi:hypothetical protein Ae201684P_016089 [Aphanomyces euteiches]|uniref:F-box domain-containing protein n=1 Tax=Aphanomyces euteiches TaxID=100861 RepID=A0A6G0XIT4_9STRA|nr:hypothetical protein Ae201684_004325 [Aphanomyces euteiches]KAH9093461.1 hypothetical protein Ae201684P_016089 [Aphanomyces euteiches]KAH9135145.1 hypothetical protein AeRB84_019334 [Aphanomyces euteiches]
MRPRFKIKWNGPVIPAEVVLRTAFFIEDPSDVFAFLDALRPLNVLGPLEYLWQLGLIKKHSEIWPALTLTLEDNAVQVTSRRSYRRFAMYYSVVRVDHVAPLRWLKSSEFNPHAQWHLSLHNTKSLALWHEWIGRRRITLLDMSKSSRAANQDNLSDILPRLTDLTALKLHVVTSSAMASLLSIAVQSEHLVQLELEYDEAINRREDRIEISSSMASNAMQWLKTHRVQVLKLSRWHVEDRALKQELYRSIFTCPTLDTLVCDKVCLTDVDFSHFTLSMRSLTLRACSLSAQQAEALAGRLVGSPVVHLAVERLYANTLPALTELFRLLRLTSIEVLDISMCYFYAWHLLTPHLRLSPLRTLIARNVDLSVDAVQVIASAIQANETIDAVDVSDNNIRFDGVRALIEAATHPDRPERMKWLQCFNCGIDETELKQLQELAARHSAELRA